MAPLVTAVIPTFRRPFLLLRAASSALTQSYESVRVCIYDNASGEETETIGRGLVRDDPRVSYHRHPTNIGAFRNFQFGLERVETPYFSFLSDDDLLLPDFYREAVAALEADRDLAFVCTQVVTLGAHGEMISHRPDFFPAGRYEPPNGFREMIRLGVPVWTGILYRSSLRESIGLLDPEIELASDVDFTLRAAARFPFRSLAVPGAIFSRAAASHYRDDNLHLLKTKPAVEAWCRSMETRYGLPPAFAAEGTAWARRNHASHLYHSAFRWAIAGEFERVRGVYATLEDYGWPRLQKLKLFAGMLRLIPPLRWVLRFREALRGTPEYKWLRRRKRERKYGAFVRYENQR